jgi:hypothetical protein
VPKRRVTSSKKRKRTIRPSDGAPLPAFMKDALAERRRAFRKKFGRAPREGEPVFFDEDADEPTEVSSVKLHADLVALLDSIAPPAVAYAFKKTGLMGTDDHSLWPKAHREEYRAAIAEFYALFEASKGRTKPDPRQWHSEIPELEVCPISREDHQLVMACVKAIAPFQARGMTVLARMELAAVLLADVCSSAYQSAVAHGKPDDASERYARFEDLTLRRAREIYAQGRV